MSKDELIERIKVLATKECWEDCIDEDTCIYDMSGSNVDDAYYGGFSSGEVVLARQIVESGLLD